MEKTILIDGKKTKLKAVAKNMIVYREQFHKDLFEAQAGIISAVKQDGTIDLSKIELESIAKLIWTFAKTADSNFPNYNEWIDNLDSFPAFDMLNETVELVVSNMTSTTNLKNVKAAASSQHKD